MRISNKSIIYYPEILPSAYQEVEYLESSGSQYIVTNYIPNNQTQIHFDFYTKNIPTGTLSGFPFFSAKNDWDFNSFSLFYNKSNEYIQFHGYNNYQCVFAENTHFVFNGNAFTKASEITNVNTGVTYTGSLGSSSNLTYLRVFGLNSSRAIGLKVKSLYTMENNTIVMNLIPARRKSDSVLGMYDTVTNTFFTNQGTGTFTAGADVYHSVSSRKSIVPCKVLPDGYKRLEYIQSSGGQYIDTGVVPSLNFKFNAKLSYSVIPENNVFCGVYSPYFILLRSNNSMQARLNNSWAILNISDFNINKIYDVETFISDNNIYALCNGETQSVIPSTTTLSQYSIYLFCCNNNNSQYKNVSAKAYNVKFTINNSLVRNFIPSQRLSDNAVGMYDTVTNTFFENQGTGSFIAGPEISNYDYISSNKQIIYENSN